MKHAHNFKDITGQRFGRLVAIRLDPAGGSKWLVYCDCGVHFFAEGTDLRRGRTTSCGCYRAERCRELGKAGYGVGRRPRLLVARITFDKQLVCISGTSDYLAHLIGVTRVCINAHVRSGKPVRGYTITIEQP